MNLDHDACYSAIRVRDARYDGRFFTAVKTTRIYCRPVCPARTPLSRNVLFYPTAAAAQEAGFHPCLRCRPETAPAAGSAPELPDSVARALALVELGALDDAGVDALAARLGVGERQLRRQFRQHLGASPVAVAQTRRVLLAKQLIHETHLPMAEIAFAAGFGSIRRFNEIFQALFGRPPGELRRSGKPDISAGPQGEIKLLLRYRPPYDWPAMLDFLRARAIPGIERVSGDSYTRTIGLDGAQGTVRVEPGAGNALQATVRFPQLHALPTLIARLRRVFDLASDPAALAAQFAHDPVMAALTAARPGLRVPGAWDGTPSALQCLALTRLIEEALTNVVKHSRARRVGVTLRQPAHGQLELEIEDDGVGFDVDAVRRANLSVGVRSMATRIARVGGALDIASAPGRTRLCARLSLPQPASAAIT